MMANLQLAIFYHKYDLWLEGAQSSILNYENNNTNQRWIIHPAVRFPQQFNPLKKIIVSFFLYGKGITTISGILGLKHQKGRDHHERFLQTLAERDQQDTTANSPKAPAHTI